MPKPTDASQRRLLSQLKPGEATKKRTVAFDDPEFASNFPLIATYLSQDSFEDGSIRQLSTMTLFLDSGGLVLVLNDRQNNRSCFTNASSLFGAMLALEESLNNDSADWKIRGGYGGKKENIPF